MAFDDRGDVVGSADPAGGEGAWSAAHVAGASPSLPLGALDSISCPSASLCVAGGHGGVYVSTDPTGGADAWSLARPSGALGVADVTCPSVSFCAGTDASGHVVTSSDPSGGTAAWSVASVLPAGAGPSFLSCPSASLCVAESANGDLAASTDPAGGASSWQQTQTGYTITGLTCPSASLCVALTSGGSFLVSPDPAAGAATWHLERPYENAVQNVVCPSESLCLAFDDAGNAFGSVDPAAGNGSWTVPAGSLDPPKCPQSTCTYGQQSVACPTASSCVLVDHFGNVFTSDSPADGASWRSVFTDAGNSVSALSCPSALLCVGLDDFGRLLTSTDPLLPAPSWKVSGSGGLSGVECASTSLCLSWTSDPFRPGSVLWVSTAPGRGGGSWKRATLLPRRHSSGAFITATACASPALCVAATTSGALLTAHPANRRLAWTPVAVDPGDDESAISCPSLSLCVIVTSHGKVLSSSRPGDARVRWRVTSLETPGASTAFGGLVGVSCPSTGLCVVLDAAGNVFTSTDPTGGRSSWQHTFLARLGYVTGFPPVAPVLSCGSASSCVIADGRGAVLTSTGPIQGASSWELTGVDPGIPITSLSCHPTWCLAGDGAGRTVVGGS